MRPLRENACVFTAAVLAVCSGLFASNATVDADGGANYTSLDNLIIALNMYAITPDTVLIIGSDQDSYTLSTDITRTNLTTIVFRSSQTNPDLFPIVTIGTALFGFMLNTNVYFDNIIFSAATSNFGNAQSIGKIYRFTNCVIRDNSSNYFFTMEGSNSNTNQFINCLFEGNAKTFSINYWGGSPTITFMNCTFDNNTQLFNVDLSSAYAANVSLKNCIFSGNSTTFPSGGVLKGKVTYSLTSESTTGYGSNCVSNSNPAYTQSTRNNPSDWGITNSSPAKDIGTSTGAPSTDIGGNTRSGTYDAGCWDASGSGAVDYTWDRSTTAGTQTGDGTWGTDSYWSATGGGGTSLTSWPGAGYGATFAGGSNGWFSISVNGTQYVDSLSFLDSSYNILGGTALNFGDHASMYVAPTKKAFISMPVASTNGIRKYGTGKLILNGATSQSGNVTINAGVLMIGAASTGGMVTGNITNNDSLVFNRSDVCTYSGNVSGSGRVVQQGGDTLKCTGIWTNSGGVYVTGGSFMIGTGGTSGSISGAITTSAPLIINRSDSYTHGGVISGTGAVTITGGGTVTFTGTNTYSGMTTVSAGTLQIGAGGTAGSILSAVTDNSALVINRSDSYSYSGAISGTGTVAKQGTGTLTLSGTNTYTGTTTVSGGTLLVTGSTSPGSAVTVSPGATFGGNGTVGGTVNVSGALSPGVDGAGILTLGNSLSFSSGSELRLDVNGTAAGTGHDRIVQTGTVTLGTGNATLAFYLGYSAAVNDSFVIIANDGADAVSGTFSGIAEGGTFVSNRGAFGYTCRVSYAGGDGNDVVVKVVSVAEAVPYPEWAYSQNVYLNTTVTGANVTGNVTNFPVLLRLNPAEFPYFSQTQPGGIDIRFTKSDGTVLAYEIERWADYDNDLDTAEIWVKVDTVFGNNKTQYFRMFWGRSDAVDSSDGGAVFDTAGGFAGVWHLKSDPAGGTGALKDVTKNANNATSTGSMTSTDLVGGQIGKGVDFDGSDDGLSIADAASLDITSGLTISGWIRPNSVNGYSRIFAKSFEVPGNWPYNVYALLFDNSSRLMGMCYNGSNAYYVNGSTTLTAGGFIYTVFTLSGTTMSLYLNGKAETNTTTFSGSIATTTQGATVGRSGASTDFFSGIIDEVTVSRTARSADWIKLCYENQRTSQMLVSLEDYSTWGFSKNVTINTSGITTTNCTGFPLLLRLTSSNFDFAQARDSGQDMRFAKSNGQKLAYQIERWDRANSLAEIWVRIDTVYGNNATQYFTMYWGKNSVASKSSGASVFDTANGYIGVWHLAESPAGGPLSITDATVNSLHATPVGNMTSGDLVDGMVGKGHDFDGTDDADSIPYKSVLNTANAVTLSAWVKFAAFNNYSRIISRGMSSNVDPWTIYSLATNVTNTQFRAEVSTGSAGTQNNVNGKNNLSTGTWYHAVFTFDKSNMKIFRNGVQDSNSVSETDAMGTAQTTPLMIGKSNYATSPMSGLIDEARVSNVARSADWIRLSYETQKASSTVLSSDSADAFRPLGIRRYGTMDSIYVGTSRWALRFARNTGGGVKFLSKDTASGNQLDANLFYFVYNGVHRSDTGTGTLTLVDSSIVFSRIRQSKIVAGQPFTIDYTVLGSGRLFVRVSARATSALSGGLEFRVANGATGNVRHVSFGSNPATSSGVAHLDTASGKYDLLMAPYDVWSSADQVTTNTKYTGLRSSTWSSPPGRLLSWEFMVDFGHTGLKDSASAYRYIEDYRQSDTLGFYAGTPLLEEAWEQHLKGQWSFDEGAGNSVADRSGNARTGTISGTAHWTDGKWFTGADSLGGSDSVTVAHSTDFSTANKTVLAWIKPRTAPTTSMSVVKKMSSAGVGFNFSGSGSGKIQLSVANGGAAATLQSRTTVTTGGWTHVAARMFVLGTQDFLLLYINGKADTAWNTELESYYGTNTSALVIGKSFDGVVEDVRFYQENLTDEEIRAIYLKGFSPRDGIYMARADNSNTVHCRMHGGSVNRYLPVLQIKNYWSSSLPGYVYIDGVVLSSGSDYYASLDDNRNQLTIGFNRVIAGNSTVYIDDNFASGNKCVGPTKKMYWGVDGASNQYFWVKNTEGSYFGSSSANEFYINWKMNVASIKGGEIWQMRSSVTNPNTSIDTVSGTNLIEANDATDYYYSSFGAVCLGMGSYLPLSTNCVSNNFTYAVEESSTVRVRLRVNERVVTNNGETYKDVTRWTIYPSGQVFRYDSLYGFSGGTGTVQDAMILVTLNDNTNASLYTNTSKLRGAIVYSGSTGYPDLVTSWLSMRNAGGNVTAPFSADYMSTFNTSYHVGVRFYQMNTAPPNWNSSSVQTVISMNIYSANMGQYSIDTISNGVQCSRFAGRRALSMVTGTLDSTTLGDFSDGIIGGGDGSGDGFNEMEGAFIVGASNNTVRFVLPAHGDTCRYYPAFRITGYTAVNRPEYVFVYRGSDTLALLEGYQFNSYVNQLKHELILQLDSIFCDSVGIYISADRTLAVKMSSFTARGGNKCDTLLWRTESEHENLGYWIMRRVNPDFYDSVQQVYRDSDTAQVKSQGDAGVTWLVKRQRVTGDDTVWHAVNEKIIAGAPSGTSVGPRDYRYIDREVYNNLEYDYKLIAVDYGQKEEEHGPVSVIPRHIAPAKFMLGLNYPNPFRFGTRIRFALPQESAVTLAVYTLQGRLVKMLVTPDKKMSADYHSVLWDGTDNAGRKVAAGQYIYRLSSRQYVKSKRMLCLR